MTGKRADDASYRGRSLLEIARAPDTFERPVFSEYHAAGSPTGLFMLRLGRFKLVAYAGARPQLFDLDADPDEHKDLAADSAFAGFREEMERALGAICDPNIVDAHAVNAQTRRIEQFGGPDAINGTADIPYTPAPR